MEGDLGIRSMLSPKIRQARRARSKSLVMGEHTASSSRPSTPGLQNRALKSGWLKKQRSIMKNWQQRWFVLRGDQLYYYKDEDESRPQGFIPLQGNQVTELVPNPEEPGRHLFEIIPGGAGDREKTAVNQEAFLLMANSQNDMEDWVKAIRRVIWAPFGGGIFGQRLEDTVLYERKYGQRLAPLLVEQCVDFIREHGLAEEGLFRMPGQANLVKDLQDAFDCGEKPLFDSSTDVHTVASLLKLYLRELPEPVIPFAKYEDFLSCAQLLSKDEDEGKKELAKQVKSLPQANYNLLKYICKFLDEVQSYSSINKMSVQNLATVFGPNILRPKMEDPVTIMEGTSLVQHLMAVLISEHGQLFSPGDADASDTHEITKCVVQQRTVEWITEENRDDSRSEHQNTNLTDPLPISAISLDVATAGKIILQEHNRHNQSATSPNKRVQTLPTWKYSFKQAGGRSNSPKLGNPTIDIPNVATSGNWLMNGLSSLRGHRRTSSGERVKDSGSSQRLSTYDNVPSSSLSLSAHSIASTTWSTSSCEISVVDTVSSCPACQGSNSSAVNSTQTDWPELDSVSQSEIKSVELDQSVERFELCISTTSSSEQSNQLTAFKDSSRCSRALQSLVTELKTELKKQRTEYESKIKRLEDTSAELRLKVHRLEDVMDQERKKYIMLEIKLRNSERAREDAEKRNQLLQKEMEEFFSTLGNLSFGTRGTKAEK
ncbi:rho GTPase-activating protein 22 isoform X1 [Microcaecilia unicolor]|uniref:Rho GTPase-activating protein 22 isoform X1 n=1 Tax=Microcaecilia unicolor TaxID=1415580 RepID=A0A6P7Y1P9_9AMPH|nr:rho GTPase-activating protein 22 isoform X1 [Microcaecilia unicolor]